MTIANSYSRVRGPAVGFFTGPLSSYARILGITDIFSTDTVSLRMTSLTQRAGTKVGDLVGEIIDTSGLGYSFTLVSAKYSTSRIGPFFDMSILSDDLAYDWPGVGSPSGTAFNVPIEAFQEISVNIFIQLVVSWNAPSSFGGHPTLGKDCIDYWKLNDDAANSNVLDSVGSATGTLQLSGGGAPQNTSAHSISGVIDKALDFDTPSNVEIDLSAVEGTPGDIFDLTKPFSISFWMLAVGLASTINVGNGSGGAPPSFWTRQVTSGGLFRMEFWMGDVTDNWVIRTLYKLMLNVLYHVVITYDGSGTIGGMKIYINGKDAFDSSQSAGLGALDINGTGLFAMLQNPNGSMDEIGLWDRVLTPAEAYGLSAGLLTY